jgi:hypothetical protein
VAIDGLAPETAVVDRFRDSTTNYSEEVLGLYYTRKTICTVVQLKVHVNAGGDKMLLESNAGSCTPVMDDISSTFGQYVVRLAVALSNSPALSACTHRASSSGGSRPPMVGLK